MLTVLDTLFFLMVFGACIFDQRCRKAAFSFLGVFFSFYRRLAGHKE